MTNPTFPGDRLPADLSKYIYGTTRLGDPSVAFDARVRMAREAMDTGVWFHTSHQYGDALSVLGKAFDEDRAHVPKVIIKIGNDSIDQLRASIETNLRPLGLSRVDIGQLCLGGPLAEDFANGGKCYEGLARLQQEGLVGHYVVEVFPWTSAVPLRALRAGHADAIVGGVITYFNPLQRFASNELWDLMRARRVPVIAMRTVAGGDVHRLRDVPGAAWKAYLQERAVEIAPIFERSQVAHWSEFCVRFAHSWPDVRATVGASGRSQGLAEFIAASREPIAPLPEPILSEIAALQRRWSSETDVLAEPWSM